MRPSSATLPPTPPSSLVSKDSYQSELTRPPRNFLELSAQLALECFHIRYSRYLKVLPKPTIMAYTQNLAVGELSYDELLILSIFTWHVNVSIPVLLLRQIGQPTDSTAALTELECKQLSDSFSPSMINSNSPTNTKRYNAILGVRLQEDDFKSRVVTLLKSLNYSFITFFLASVSAPFRRYTTNSIN